MVSYFDVLSVLSVIFTVVGFVSPFTFLLGLRKAGTGMAPIIPYEAMAVNCMTWVSYGIVVNEYAIYISNGIGLVAATLFIGMYLGASTPEARRKRAPSVLVTFLICATVAIIAYATRSDFFLGLLGAICGVCLFAAPLSIVTDVIRTRSTSGMSFPFSLIAAFTTLSWVLYGFEIHDMFVLIPNALALGLVIFQLSLFAFFCQPRNPLPAAKAAAAAGLSLPSLDLAPSSSNPDDEPDVERASADPSTEEEDEKPSLVVPGDVPEEESRSVRAPRRKRRARRSGARAIPARAV
uniref:Sugar transporter SWEET1 n=1 Tax=Sexangularia sp. CB-2014 TaxID=1486929 RepID=A0A7S1VSR5_9EUKA